MKFVVYSSNFSPELTGIGKYNGDMARQLSISGIKTHVITAPPYYPEWKKHPSYKNFWSSSLDKNGTVIHRAPIYVPKNVSVLKRLVHLFSFAFSSVVHLAKLIFSKPSVIFVVQPTLFCAPAALFFGLLTGAKTVMHIQDFELDAMLGLGMNSGSKRWCIARWLERFILRRFDVVSSISFSMLEKAKRKGVKPEKLLFFPNWADTSFVTPEVSGEELKASWGYNEADKVILYSGNIGNKQGLEVVLEAAEAFVETPEVKFLIVGCGTHKDEIVVEAQRRRLNNIQFKPLQPYEKLPQLLALADIHLVVQRKGAADAVLPSKLTNILSCGGHALVTAEMHTELGQISKSYPGIYHIVEPENSEAFIAGIKSMLATDLSKTNKVAWAYATNFLNKETVINRFISELQQTKKPFKTNLVKESHVK